MTETKGINFQTKVDLGVENAAILAYYTDFLSAERQIQPRLTMFKGSEHILSVQCRTYDQTNEADHNRTIMEAMYLVPAVSPDLSILSMASNVRLIGATVPAIVTIAINRSSALAEVFPWEISTDGNVTYNMNAELDPHSTGVYSEQIAHMLPVFARTRRSAFPPTELIQFLSDRGHEITLYNDWTLSNIDPRCYN